MEPLRSRLPSPATVIALIALFVALGGTSYALARNSIATKHLKRGAVTSDKIKDGTLLARDFKRGVLPRTTTAASGQAGARGEQGPAGAAIVASRIGGASATATSTSFGATTTLLSWTQPPGALDEVRGYMQVTWPAGCNQNGHAIEVRITDEAGTEISPDLPNAQSVAGNGGTNDPDTTGAAITHGGLDGSLGIDFVVPLPVERAQFAPPAVATARQVRLQVRRISGCNANVVLSNWRLWVTRFTS
jgi:hypothetical protein